jgi:hypothetical protein
MRVPRARFMVVRLSGSGDPVCLEPGRIHRWRTPRMTVRFLLVVVALAAVVTEASLAGWRAVTYRMRAGDHERHLNSARSYLYDSEALRRWHERMGRKYQQAASRPWWPVAPDPTKPE